MTGEPQIKRNSLRALFIWLAMLHGLATMGQSLAGLPARHNRLVGHHFPLMQLELPDSTMFNTAALAGKTVYIDCWFTTCPPCVTEMPFAASLYQFFATDTNVVFLNICIDQKQQRPHWRSLVSNSPPNVVNVFYARNQPQSVNLLQQLAVNTFPLYFLMNNLQITGYDAPRPSEKGWVHWAIYQAGRGVPLSKALAQMQAHAAESTAFLNRHMAAIELKNQP